MPISADAIRLPDAGPARDPRVIRNPRKVDLTPLMVEILLFLHLYGGHSTTSIIFKYLQLQEIYKPRKKELAPSSKATKSLNRALNDLFDGGYVDRYEAQMAGWRPRAFPVETSINQKGEEALVKLDLFNPYAPNPWGSYEHNKVNAEYYQCYYLNALELGWTFEPQHDFMRRVFGEPIRPKGKHYGQAYYVRPYFEVPDKRRNPKTGDLEDFMRKVYTDTLFRFGNDQGIYVTVHLEADRGWEAANPTQRLPEGMRDRKTYKGSASDYADFIASKRYKDWYKLGKNNGAQVHFITTKEQKQYTMLGKVAEVMPNGCPWFLTRYAWETGEAVRPMRYANVLGSNFMRFDGFKVDGRSREPIYGTWNFLGAPVMHPEASTKAL